MTQTELLPETTTRRPERDGRRSDMVLIQVPDVRVHRARIESGRSRNQPHGFGRPVGTRRPRRRLKREIRVAAFAGLAFAPIILAASVWCLHPSRPLAAAEVATTSRPIDEPDSTPAAVLISIEPTVSANESETETPVVFPGYLLPDDHREEPVHEGS
ncbi:MAG: hypothetical protein P4L85_09790 [Paludisphaera borealis]|uniref:hypothetical protein n=1 Tax=Paludisphaera borealis TaxID=1387353 RepID=UPI0028465797|nr:hypothetical protein [Paludisphaera borealis]MDR3619631.1 hypothetical protein [Paludisphaera borealis]